MQAPMTVGLTRRLPAAVHDRLAARFDLLAPDPDDRPLGANGLAEHAASCDILLPTVTDRIDRDVLAAGRGRLRLVANFGVGVDHIDRVAAAEFGIAVTNTPDVLTDATADLTLALILMTTRRLGEGERLLRAGQWRGWAPVDLLGHGLQGRRLGIVGMGRIGRAVAARAGAFGLSLRYTGRSRLAAAEEAALGLTWHARLADMLPKTDILSLHCPLTAETRGLVGTAALAALPRGSFVINTARGGIVDEAALAAALADGHLAGAGLDVYDGEPRVASALLSAPGVVALPHMGSATLETRTAMGLRAAANIEAFADSRPLPDPVQP